MIDFSVENITTVDECDILLVEANEDIDILNDEKTILGVSKGKAEKISVEVQAEITATQAELAGIEGMMDTLPPVKKRRYERKVSRLQNKLESLGFRKEDKGGLQLLKKQFEEGKIDVLLAEIQRFIAAVQARRAAILAAGS